MPSSHAVALKPRITTLRFLLTLTALIAITGWMISFLVAANSGNPYARTALIFIAMAAPLLVMTAAFWLQRFAGK